MRTNATTPPHSPGSLWFQKVNHTVRPERARRRRARAALSTALAPSPEFVEDQTPCPRPDRSGLHPPTNCRIRSPRASPTLYLTRAPTERQRAQHSTYATTTNCHWSQTGDNIAQHLQETTRAAPTHSHPPRHYSRNFNSRPLDRHGSMSPGINGQTATGVILADHNARRASGLATYDAKHTLLRI